MIRRFSVDYAILTIIFDAVVTLIALLLAVSLRPNLPQFPFLLPMQNIEIPLWVFVTIPILWVLVFFVSSVYDPEKTYTIVDELQTFEAA